MFTAIAAQTLPVWLGWRSQCWIAAALAAVTALVIFLFYRDLSPRLWELLESENSESSVDLDTSQDARKAKLNETYDDGKKVYRSPRLWLLSIVIVFWALTYVLTFITQHHGLEPANATKVTSYLWIVFTMSVFLSGWLSDFLGVRKSITAFGGFATGLRFIYGSSLPLDLPETLLMLLWSTTGFFAGFIYPAWCAIYS